MNYTGVGSRETPDEILQLMRDIAYRLAGRGYTLRSGGADGADKAFQDGWWDNYQDTPRESGRPRAEIYIAWSGFNGLKKGMYGDSIIIPSGGLSDKAFEIAATMHPAWDKCSQGAKSLHSRNVFQVLGKSLDEPSKFLIAYAKTNKQGIPQGGTATAIKLAEGYGVPCFNLYKEDDRLRLEAFVRGGE